MKKVIFLFEEKDRVRNEYSSAVIWWYGILENLGYEVEYYNYFEFNFNKFYNHVKNNKPDFIIHAVYDKLHTEFVKLREFSKVYVMHSDDDWRFDAFAKYWIPLVDGTISLCGADEDMKKKYKSQGCNDEQFIKSSWSFNPNTMLYSNLHERKTISHVGSIYGERADKINWLNQNGLNVVVHQGLYYETFKSVLASSKYSLCFTKSSDLNVNQLKGRLFEIPVHCPIITEPFPDMNKYYNVDEDLILFNTVEELKDKVEKYNKDYNSYNNLYINGKRRCLTDWNCYRVWDKDILPKIDKDYISKNINKIMLDCHGIDLKTI